MKRFAVILAVLLLAVFALFEFGAVAICDGWYDLNVEIDAKSAVGVSRVCRDPRLDAVNSKQLKPRDPVAVRYGASAWQPDLTSPGSR